MQTRQIHESIAFSRTRYMMAQQEYYVVDHRYQQTPVVSLRGILNGLWLMCAFVTVLALMPGVDLTLGNLPGDISAGASGGSLRVPFVTIALLAVTLTGVYYRISRILPDR